jgi:hypothetical protein
LNTTVTPHKHAYALWDIQTHTYQADAADAVDVGVVNAGEEVDLGRGHGVLQGQKQLQLREECWVSHGYIWLRNLLLFAFFFGFGDLICF